MNGRIPILCFIGSSGSGKTTLIEKVINILTVKGLRVGTIKHTHKDFEIDMEGKDSWKHKRAGARIVILASPQKYAVISDVDKEMAIEDFVERFIGPHMIDLLIVEGFKRDKYPKVEVYRRAVSKELRFMEDPTIIALAMPSEESSCLPQDLPIPVFDINDAEGLSDFIIDRLSLKENIKLGRNTK